MRGAFMISLFSAAASSAGSLLDYSYGVLEESRGNQHKAYGFYEKAYEKSPMTLPLVRLMAEKAAKDGDPTAALAIYQKAFATRAHEPLIFLEYGDFIGQLKGDNLPNQQELQRNAYEKALNAMPGNYLPIERLIRLAREQGDDVRARVLLEKLNTDSADAVLYFVATTKSLYDSRDEKAAKRIDGTFEKAMRDHPEWEDIARKASDHFRSTGRLGRAIEVLGKHLEAQPASLNLKIRQGILMFAAERDTEGLRALREVLEIHPQKSLAHESLAKYYRLNGQPAEARNHAAELLKFRGGTAEEFLQLAAEMIAQEDFRAARLLLEKAVFFHEKNAELRMKLAIATSRDPETKHKAARLFREAEALVADSGAMDPAFLIESAKQLIAQGDSKAAEERLRTAIRGFPKEAKAETAAALRALAGIWITEGRNLEAAKALEKRAATLEN